MRRPDCAEVVRALWDYLDGELAEPQLTTIDEHLRRCDGCRAHFDFERRLLAEIRALRQRLHDPATLRTSILDAINGAGTTLPPTDGADAR